MEMSGHLNPGPLHLWRIQQTEDLANPRVHWMRREGTKCMLLPEIQTQTSGEVSGQFRTLRKAELCDPCMSSTVIRVVKSRRLR
jgi:hypothetical protein